jgi:electron transfer flavoprotein alpha/beta subunit
VSGDEAGTPAGSMVDELGVTVDLDDGDRLTDVLLIGKTTDLATGQVGLVIAASSNLDWISQAGLLTVAQQIIADQNRPELA